MCYFPNKIPAELRNIVYHHLLPTSAAIFYGYSGKFKPPPVLQVCRQIREEASAIYYAENVITAFVNGFDSDIIFKVC